MYSFDLDTNILCNHKLIATPGTARSKHERDGQKRHECAFLTCDEPNIIHYTTFSPNCAIQSMQKTDFTLPYQMAINLYSTSEIKRNKPAHVEIPDCTHENLKAFNDPYRPKFIKDSDLRTSVISINDTRANVEYIRPQYILNRLNNIIRTINQQPHVAWRDFEWFKIDNTHDQEYFEYHEMENIYRAVFSTDNGIPHNLMERPSNATVMQYLEKLMSVATRVVTIYQEIYVPENNATDVYKLPVALFKNHQSQIIWQAKAVKER